LAEVIKMVVQLLLIILALVFAGSGVLYAHAWTLGFSEKTEKILAAVMLAAAMGMLVTLSLAIVLFLK
jgi:hypothetical protein